MLLTFFLFLCFAACCAISISSNLFCFLYHNSNAFFSQFMMYHRIPLLLNRVRQKPHPEVFQLFSQIIFQW